MTNITKGFLLTFIFLFGFSILSAQNSKLKVSAIGFYNLENLFDTIDAPDIWDEEFTPSGSKLWNTKKYYQKLDNMSKVISKIATEKSKDGLAILGVSEIENRTVLEDLVKQPEGDYDAIILAVGHKEFLELINKYTRVFFFRRITIRSQHSSFALGSVYTT